MQADDPVVLWIHGMRTPNHVGCVVSAPSPQADLVARQRWPCFMVWVSACDRLVDWAPNTRPTEHGPFRVTHSLGLVPANYSWDINHNVIYVDQPMNTGFSFSTVRVVRAPLHT